LISNYFAKLAVKSEWRAANKNAGAGKQGETKWHKASRTILIINYQVLFVVCGYHFFKNITVQIFF